VLVLVLAACRPSHAPYDLAVMRTQLVASGYAVTPAPVPSNLSGLPKRPGVIDVACLDAAKSGKTDTLCVVRCRDASTCASASEDTGETYGVMQGGPTLFVHQQCAIDPAWKPGSRTPSFDCTEARRAVGVL
jgi:hypothetical protein